MRFLWYTVPLIFPTLYDILVNAPVSSQAILLAGPVPRVDRTETDNDLRPRVSMRRILEKVNIQQADKNSEIKKHRQTLHHCTTTTTGINQALILWHRFKYIIMKAHVMSKPRSGALRVIQKSSYSLDEIIIITNNTVRSFGNLNLL